MLCLTRYFNASCNKKIVLNTSNPKNFSEQFNVIFCNCNVLNLCAYTMEQCESFTVQFLQINFSAAVKKKTEQYGSLPENNWDNFVS